MTAFPFLAVSFLINVLAVLFVICSVALVLVVLIQKGRGGGLSGAFGGAMASGILGSKTGDFLTWVTIVLVGVFLTIAVMMAALYEEDVSDFGPVQQRQPVTQEQTFPSARTETDTGGSGESGAVGGLEVTQPQTPATQEEALPVVETGVPVEENDANLPGN